jgi:Ca-activated chloride channel family protein
MKARKLINILILAALLLAACSPSIAPAPLATMPRTYSGSAGESSGGIVVTQESAQLEQPAQLPPLAGRPYPTAIPVEPYFYEYEPTAPPYYDDRQPSQPPSLDNQFQDYGVNPYTDSQYDHLSTFAVDVDTASYTVARRYLSDGQLPPPDAVRVEEFINYFDQQYKDPGKAIFGIVTDGAPSPFEYGTTLLRVGIQGRQVQDWARKSANLTFVIDVSGSMHLENRLELVKRSLEILVENLYPDDTVTIVVYGSSARLVLKATSARNQNKILTAIRELQPEGSTNAEAGLRIGYEQAMRAYQAGGINRLILCSDGVANVGLVDAQAILETVRGYVEEGVTLTTLGFGMGNFNDVLMEQLADQGDGFYAYIDTLDEARKIFSEDLTSTLQVIAREAKVQVDFNPDLVAYYRLVGYENRDVADQDFRNDSVDAGEVGAGHSVTALYAVRLQPGAQGRIATVQLRWQDPDNYSVYEINQNFDTWDLVDRFERADPNFQLTALVGQFAETLRQSPWALETPLGSLLEYAYNLPRPLRGDPQVAEFIQLLEQASRLRW